MPEKPNFLLVFGDQHRASALGAYGNPQVDSPHFDAFAREGLLFANAFTNCPLCVPARGTILTGTHPMRHRAAVNDLPVDTGLPSLATELKKRGYATGYVGKWHLAGIPRETHVEPERRMGFEFWRVRQCSHDYLRPEYHDERGQLHQENGYEPEIQTRLAEEFLGAQGNAPWALVLSWGPPHDPYDQLPESYLSRYHAGNIDLPPNVPESILIRPGVLRDKADIKEWMRGYYAHVTALDDQFGRLISTLKRTGKWENTVVLYFSDHGDMLGGQGLSAKQLPYEESCHVPLLVGGGWPPLRRGRCDELFSLVDLTPTLLELAGIEAPPSMQGKRLGNLMTDENARGPGEIYLYSLIPCHDAEDRGDCSWRAVRTRRHTYVLNADSGGDWLLYDNDADPFQRNNLVHTPALRPVLLDLRRRTEDLAGKYDGLMPWPELLTSSGLLENWNKSQREFNRRELTGVGG